MACEGAHGESERGDALLAASGFISGSNLPDATESLLAIGFPSAESMQVPDRLGSPQTTTPETKLAVDNCSVVGHLCALANSLPPYI